MAIDNIATHEGVCTGVKDGRVTVRIESVSACASCQAHSKCGFAESKNKTLDIPARDWADFKAGDVVRVQIDEQHGLLAVWFAYLLPALLMLGVIVGLSLAGVAEGLVALGGLAAAALYVVLLFAVRRRVDNRFTLTVAHADSRN